MSLGGSAGPPKRHFGAPKGHFVAPAGAPKEQFGAPKASGDDACSLC